MPRKPSRPLVLVPFALLALVATACSSGSSSATGSPTPYVTTTTTAPSATPAVSATKVPTSTPTTPGTPSTAVTAKDLSAWKGCGSGFQCATLTVPLDPTKPALGTVGIYITRHKATGSNRIGSLLVNPGGPGASAVDFLQGSYTSFPSTLRSHFDLVAFDPRGIGHTAPVRCLTTSQLDAYFHVDPVPDSPAEVTTLDNANKKLTEGCEARSKRILPYVGTRIVAQDMDRVRQAVGDQKLTYLGYSYGTAIGASYLDQFPTHVRAIVMDGALDPTLTWSQLLAGQSQGFDVALKAFLANCQSTNCAFRQAVSGDLGAAYDALAKKVESKDLPGEGSRTVGPGEFTLGVGAGLYSKANGWPAIAAALAQAEKGSGQILLELSDEYTDRSSNGYSNLNESNFAVNCIDRPWPRTDAPYYALAKQVGQKYPRFGPAIALSGLGCKTWPLDPTSTPHAVSAPSAPTVVVIGGLRDPATPYMWAQGLAKQLTHAVLLTHNGDGHTVFRVGAPSCILDPVDAYFISLTIPKTATC